MPINHNALSSKFQVPTLKEQERKAAFRRWQAVFYTLRHLVWDKIRTNILTDAFASGAVERGDIPEEVIKQLYSEAWKEFEVEFDAAFIKATVEEMVEYAKERLKPEITLDYLLKLNKERSAKRFNR
ncbi:hypothetical protein [Myxosarcina sp. GI1]|uniref:hypothetical protein n=1 Tax=Myxosarcina sp. GI1 TaxID=1541065 RepID=UPI000569D9B9|nr:hypothetical protein [Myxosarcina sp. GI1]